MKALVLVAAVVLLASVAEAGQGWYLMVPPTSDYDDRADYLKGFKVLSSRPLSQWGQEGAYDSAAECEAVKATQVSLHHRFFEHSSGEYQKAIGAKSDPVTLRLTRVLSEADNASVDAYQASRCVASDDPRLAR